LDILIQILQVMKKQEDPLAVFIFLLGDSPNSWKPQQQKSVTLSTAEAEFVSLTECAKQSI